MARPTDTRRPLHSARGVRRSASRLVAALGVAALLGACAAGPTEPGTANEIRVRHDDTTPPPPQSDSTPSIAGNYQGPLI